MNQQTIKARLIEIENYLDRPWKSLSDNFIDRLLARAEYDRLTKELKYE